MHPVDPVPEPWSKRGERFVCFEEPLRSFCAEEVKISKEAKNEKGYNSEENFRKSPAVHVPEGGAFWLPIDREDIAEPPYMMMAGASTLVLMVL